MGLAGIILAASCSEEANKDNEPDVQQPVQLVFKGVQSDGGADTKSYLDGGSVYWNTYDAINVFAGGSSYRFDTKEGGATVTFVGVVLSEDVIYFGLYPYNESATYSYNSSTKDITYNTTFPSSQKALENSFAMDANITVAQTTNTEMAFHFKNVCGLIKFNITSSEASLPFTKAVLKGRNSEDIAGDVTITYNHNNEPSTTNPSISITGSAVKTITLNVVDDDPGDAITPTFAKDTDYYFVVPPTSFSTGYTITFYNDDESISKVHSIATSKEVKRSKILDAGTYNYVAP